MIFVDAIHVKVRDGQVTNRPFYVVIGVTVDGRRDVLGIWAGVGGEGAKFWLAVLTEVKNRGTADVCIAVCDGLSGLGDAITPVWPATVVQTCILHLIRNTFRYASRRDWEAMAKDLRPVYTAPTEQAAKARYDEFAEHWCGQYPAIGTLWTRAWSEFVPFLDCGARCKIGASHELIFAVRKNGGCGPFVSSRGAGPGVLAAAGHARVAARGPRRLAGVGDRWTG